MSWAVTQIDNALKDEYFKSQEDMIADIEEANKNQIELLEKQIKIIEVENVIFKRSELGRY